ncbi:MAG: peptidase and in kexin sedolisin [Bryobacterales bacterium]|nr:peptidase and in kexin sedolisin [Bryobacterales bacterium]
MKRSLVAGIFLIWLTTSSRAENKLAPDLVVAKGHTALDVIVQFTSTPTERHHDKVRRRGGELKHDLSGALNGAHYTIPAHNLVELSRDPEIAYISPNRSVHAMLDYANPTVNANIARQYGWDGKGVGIALIDSGLEDRPDLDTLHSNGSLSSRIIYTASFLPNTLPYYTQTNDDYGHGTHVAGILAGNGLKSTCSRCTRSFIGIAPNANIISLRVLDAEGSGTDTSVINAIHAAIALAPTYNIKVINLSLGRPVYESYSQDPLCQAVERAWRSGIVVVVAAGNNGRDNSQGTDGYGTIMAPANDPYVITVGAMKDMRTVSRSDDLIASYSSKGPTPIDHIVKPDIVAPGNRVISLIRAGSYIYKDSSAAINEIANSYYMPGAPGTSTMYYQLSGTSMAAPVVAGAAALLFQQNPSLTPDQVKVRLMKTATKAFPASSIATDPITGISYVSQYDIFTIGAGYLDVWAALNNTDLASGQTGAALSPTAVYDPTTGDVYVNNSSIAVWNSSPIWGSDVIWGPSVIDALRKNVVWGSKTNMVWGASGTEGFNVLWSSAIDWSVVWGDSTHNTAASANQLLYGEN